MNEPQVGQIFSGRGVLLCRIIQSTKSRLTPPLRELV